MIVRHRRTNKFEFFSITDRQKEEFVSMFYIIGRKDKPKTLAIIAYFPIILKSPASVRF